jgi:hypothetical protein
MTQIPNSVLARIRTSKMSLLRSVLTATTLLLLIKQHRASLPDTGALPQLMHDKFTRQSSINQCIDGV